MEVIAIMNPQRGTGKTTTAVNLSICLAQKKWKVLLVDLDSQGGSTERLGVDPQEVAPSAYEVMSGKIASMDEVATDTPHPGLKLTSATLQLSMYDGGLPSDLTWPYTLRHAVENSASMFDFVVLDCPSSLGALWVNSYLASSHFIIPLRIGPKALWGMDFLAEQVAGIKHKSGHNANLLGVLATMVKEDEPFHLEILEEVKRYFGLKKLFDTVIPYVNSSPPLEGASPGREHWAFPRTDYYSALAEEVLVCIRKLKKKYSRRNRDKVST